MTITRAGLTSAACLAAALAVLQHGLPAETFFAGDSGVRLAVVQNALNHPLHPLELPVPTAGEQVLPYLDPFYSIHGSHAHANTPELFPLLTAPLFAALGQRGLYVLPAAGGVAALFAWLWIGTALDRRRAPLLIAAIVLLSSPLIFYSLEFWEHSLAFGAASLGLAFLLASFEAAAGSPPVIRIGAGCCFGVAFLLRPEAALFAIACIVAVLIRIPTSRRPAPLLELTAGGLLPILPLLAHNVAHFGAITGPHLAVHATLLLNENWWTSRRELISAWFLAPTRANLITVAPTVVLVILQAFPSRRMAGTGLLTITAIVFLFLAVLTSPNDGGAQWGPRYLLLIYGPLSVLVADGLQNLSDSRRLKIGLTVAAILVGVWVQRASYRELLGTKRIYSHALALVRDVAPPGTWVVSDVWWLDEVAASAASSRTFVFVRSAKEEAAVIAALRRAEAGDVARVSSTSDSPARLLALPSPGCAETMRRSIGLPALTAVRLSCRPD